jgi:hypothetical protein
MKRNDAQGGVNPMVRRSGRSIRRQTVTNAGLDVTQKEHTTTESRILVASFSESIP